MEIQFDAKQYPEIVDQVFFDDIGLGFNHETLLVEHIKEMLGIELGVLCIV